MPFGTSRAGRVLLFAGMIVGGLLAVSTVASFVIHLWLLNTDQFNWLEGPKTKLQAK